MYSSARIFPAKCHIFDHITGKLLCLTPIKNLTINKTKYNKEDMKKIFAGYAIRRGGPNPYKWTCKKCEKLIGNKEVKAKWIFYE